MSTRCEKAVEALAAGGTLLPWKALRHASRCPSCAAARDDFRRIAKALSKVSPLSAAQRRLWTSAVTEPNAELSAAWRFRHALAGAFAALVVVSAGAWWSTRPHDLPVGLPGIATVEPSANSERSLPEVEGLRGEVLALSRELDILRRRADLLDARKDVEALLARLGPQRGPNGL